MSFCWNNLNLRNLHTAIMNLDALLLVTPVIQWAFTMFMQTPNAVEERTETFRQTKLSRRSGTKENIEKRGFFRTHVVHFLNFLGSC